MVWTTIMYFIILININKTSKTRDINKNDIEKMGTNILSKKEKEDGNKHMFIHSFKYFGWALKDFIHASRHPLPPIIEPCVTIHFLILYILYKSNHIFVSYFLLNTSSIIILLHSIIGACVCCNKNKIKCSMFASINKRQ